MTEPRGTSNDPGRAASLISAGIASGLRRLGIPLAISVAVHVALVASVGAGHRSFWRSSTDDFSRDRPVLEARFGPSPVLAQATAATPTPIAEIAVEPVVAPDAPPARPREAVAPVVEDAAPLSIPLPEYIPTARLSRSPRPLEDPTIDFPAGDEPGQAGRVVLELLVSDTGTVDSVAVIESDLPEAYQERAAQAFRQLRFAPGEWDGKVVAARMGIEVRFDAVP